MQATLGKCTYPTSSPQKNDNYSLKPLRFRESNTHAWERLKSTTKMETHEVEFPTSWRGRNPVLCRKAVAKAVLIIGMRIILDMGVLGREFQTSTLPEVNTHRECS